MPALSPRSSSRTTSWDSVPPVQEPVPPCALGVAKKILAGMVLVGCFGSLIIFRITEAGYVILKRNDSPNDIESTECGTRIAECGMEERAAESDIRDSVIPHSVIRIPQFSEPTLPAERLYGSKRRDSQAEEPGQGLIRPVSKAKWYPKAGGWRLEAGDWRLETGGWRPETGGAKRRTPLPPASSLQPQASREYPIQNGFTDRRVGPMPEFRPIEQPEPVTMAAPATLPSQFKKMRRELRLEPEDDYPHSLPSNRWMEERGLARPAPDRNSPLPPLFRQVMDKRRLSSLYSNQGVETVRSAPDRNSPLAPLFRRLMNKRRMTFARIEFSAPRPQDARQVDPFGQEHLYASEKSSPTSGRISGFPSTSDFQAEARLRNPIPPVLRTKLYPTLIYRKSGVVISVPVALEERKSSGRNEFSFSRIDPPKTWVRSVRLHKISGPNDGEILWQPVRGDHASFEGLSSGAYNVYYSKTEPNAIDSFEESSPHRRIIIELESSQVVSELESRFAKLLARDTAATELVGESDTRISHTSKRNGSRIQVRNRVLKISERFSEEGWWVLGLGRANGSLKHFRDAIHVIGREVTARKGNDPIEVQQWIQALNGSPSFIAQIRKNYLDPLEVAEQLADYVGRQPLLARAFHGLGKAFDSLGGEPADSIDGAEWLAVVCYLTALELDSELFTAAHDLAAVSSRIGWFDQASASLEFVRSWSEHQKIALDPEDCHELITAFTMVLHTYGPESSEAQWAKERLRNLEVIRHELWLNFDGFFVSSR